jgi:hemoglobin
MLLLALVLAVQPTPPGEEPVDPYPVSNANAGAAPFSGDGLWRAFHAEAGVKRVVNRLVDLSEADPRISEIFKSHDMIRLRRTLFEQFCYLMNGGCSYSGRDMKLAHKDLGIQTADMNALIENLQRAMREENIPFTAQNRLLAKLAPMKGDVVER